MGSVNLMGNNDTLKIIRGKDKIKPALSSFPVSSRLIARRVYNAVLKFDKNDKPTKTGTSERSFCTECSSMLWNYHPEYPDVLSFHIYSDQLLIMCSGSIPLHRPLTSRIPCQAYRKESR